MIVKYMLYFSFLYAVNGLGVPKYIKVCRKSDKEINDCALKNAIDAVPSILKGDKKYNVPSLSPLNLPEVAIEQNQFSVILKNMVISGLDTVTLNEVKIDHSNKQWQIGCHFDYLNLWSDYNMHGRILVLSLEGEGKANVTFYNTSIIYKFNYDFYNKQQIKYANITDSKLDYKVGLISLYFSNLFGGDKRLGDEVNKFLNENWIELEKEIGPTVGKVINTIITSLASNLFDLVPYDEVLPD